MSAMTSEPLSKLDSARMRALRNAIYHTMRRTFFERADRFGSFVVVLLGTAVVAAMADVRILGAVAAVVGTLQLIWAPGSKARDHAVLQGKFYALVGRAEATDDADDALAREIEREMAGIYSEESTTMNAVNALAYNAAQSAHGRPARTLFEVLWWERLLANVIAFSSDRFLKRYDAKRARESAQDATESTAPITV